LLVGYDNQAGAWARLRGCRGWGGLLWIGVRQMGVYEPGKQHNFRDNHLSLCREMAGSQLVGQE